MDYTNIKRPTAEQIAAGKEEGYQGFELATGYVVSEFGSTGMYEINAVDAMQTFEDDAEAVSAAMADGLPVIPEEELPENFDRRYLGWIDTPENRKRIEVYTDAIAKGEYPKRDDTFTASNDAADAYIAKYCVSPMEFVQRELGGVVVPVCVLGDKMRLTFVTGFSSIPEDADAKLKAAGISATIERFYDGSADITTARLISATATDAEIEEVQGENDTAVENAFGNDYADTVSSGSWYAGMSDATTDELMTPDEQEYVKRACRFATPTA